MNNATRCSPKAHRVPWGDDLAATNKQPQEQCQ